MYVCIYVCMYSNICFTVRLVDGPAKYEGRVEVNYNGEWGTVCKDEWDLNDAQVVCTELGFSAATAAPNNAIYGEGSGQIWLDDVNCVGTEEMIRNCSHSGWGSHNCTHKEDVSINCTAGTYIGTCIIVACNGAWLLCIVYYDWIYISYSTCT